MSISSIPNPKAISFLKRSVNIWFSIVVLGQLIFALYIFGVYGVNGIAGDFEKWNDTSTHGYIQKDIFGNILFGIHVLLAMVTAIGGPLQLLSKVRNRFPKFHRINGRIYIFAAFLIASGGLYLTWVRGIVGGLVGAVFISVNGFIILTCAYFTVKNAIGRRLEDHRKWALRLYFAMSGVWFFRIFLMLWLTINQGPVGFDMNTFEGPALNMLYVSSYILPVVFLELYFRTKQASGSTSKWMLSIFILLLSGCMLIGTFSATMGMWLPSL